MTTHRPEQEGQAGLQPEIAYPGVIHRMADNPGYLPSYDLLSEAIEGARLDHKLIHDLEDWMGGRVYEIWNKDYIDVLTDYLRGRIDDLWGTEESPVTILEVGAGDGRLSYFLRQKLHEIAAGKVNVVATDSGVWDIHPIFPVDDAGVEEAVQKYKPRIVIWSWMPYDNDYTRYMRPESSVEEYILIGESGYLANSGHSWLTWGVDFDRKNELPPYEKDGFEQQFLEDLSALQVSRMRLLNADGIESSGTVSFRRIHTQET